MCKVENILDKAFNNVLKILRVEQLKLIPYFKYKKRVKNRNKLYQKRIKQGRKGI
ncbi:hypothetical protein K144312032_12250 [Clostridium tetani]|nr:hypothetical protein K144312032_12250 [Clostridium tetani]